LSGIAPPPARPTRGEAIRITIYNRQGSANKWLCEFMEVRRYDHSGAKGPGRMKMRLLLALAILVVSPGLAFAHTGIDHGAGFFHGFAHPVGGLDHVLAMVAVGVFAFVLGGRALWLVPLSFVGAMVAGFALGIAQIQLPFVELAIALSSVAIGGAAGLGRPMPVGAAMALVGTFAVFHGHAHGAEMAESTDGLTYALGFIAATALLHLAGIAAAFGIARLTGRFGKTMARLAGAAFAVGGLGVLAGWL
jgi:urease accessory protein